MALADELIALLEPLAAEHGLELVTAEVAGGAGRPIVRIFLDREGGIDIETIAAANEWVSTALDGVRGLTGTYTLEVSSPGIERPLRKLDDFRRFAGQTASVHTTQPLSGRSRFTGTIVAVDATDVVLDIDGTEQRVPFETIGRARLKVDFAELTDGNRRDA